MKPFLRLLPWLLVFILGGGGLRAAPPQPDAGGVTIEVPEEGKIEAGTALSVSFPAAMVPADAIDRAGEPAPVRFVPPLPGEWLWKSQTDGEFRVKEPVTPGQTYAASLAPGLRDAGGAAVAPPGWGAKLHTEPFTVEAQWEEDDDQLPALPEVVLKFSYRVRLDDVARRIYFQDRDSGARREAELSLHDEDRDDEPETAVLRATPLEGLPGGRTWDLIVEDVREQGSGQGIPYLKRVALGTTAPLKLRWIGGFNLPLEKPVVRGRFDDNLDPATVNRDTVSVAPPVANVQVRAEDEDVVVEGDFDRSKHYEVTISPAVKGERGYGLAAPARWGATFRPKASALFFPQERVSERAALGLRFRFLQVHTGALRWRLAAVPLPKLAAVGERLREFTQAKKNPFSGEAMTDDGGVDVPQPTELLVDSFGLETRAEGTFPASAGEEETLRELRWEAPGGKGMAAGAYLLEVDGPRADGGRGSVGNRSLVFFSESVVTEKRTPDTVLARVAGMADGLPRAGITVRALSASNFEVARAVTDRDGLARFASADLLPPKGKNGGEPARSLVADTPEGPAISTLDGQGLDDVYIPDKPAKAGGSQTLRAVLVTDRSLYRPGQTARIKGLMRTGRADGGGGGRLRVPAGKEVDWTITSGEGDQVAAQGSATVDAEGGWEAQWAIPTGTKLGDYYLQCQLKGAEKEAKAKGDNGDEEAEDGGAGGGGDASTILHVQDYKVPLFEVKARADAVAPPGSSASVCRVDAGYFSGQPVAGAKVAWRVRWDRSDDNSVPQAGVPDDPEAVPAEDEPMLVEIDYHSERAVSAPADADAPTPETKGEARLDGKGGAEIHAEMPPNLPGARYRARWEVAVTSADGQSVATGDAPAETIMRQPVLLGIATSVGEGGKDAPAASDLPPAGTVRVRLGAFDAADKAAQARNVKVELFRVGTKTVRETVAPFVVRYRNTPLFELVKTVTVPQVGPDTAVDLPAGEAGSYVAVASADGLRPVSAEALVDGPGEDEVPVETSTSLQVLRVDKKEYVPGETAALVTRSPVSGVAWVSIETDRVLDTVLVALPGSTTRIEFPVKPEYAPDATVAVYLLRPGGGDRLPAERFGSAKVRVRRPDRQLELKPALAQGRVRPGEEVRGTVRVTSAGRPVAGADVTVWAVDDAVLALGEWKAPDFLTAFYPSVPHRVKTYAALAEYLLDVSRKSLFQKGFVIGGGGEEFGNKFVRKDFQPLAYWKTGLRTDAEGNVPLAFAAPDNLTRYRVVAVAQTRAGQFGEGEGSVEVAKPLVVEPSLPRFLRAGDEVELRAVVRQSARDQASVAAACTAAGLTLEAEGKGAGAVAVGRDQPAVFRFRATVPDGPTSAKVTFHAGTAPADPDTADAAEVTLPILPPTILRRESMAGSVPPGGDAGALLPPDARRPGAKGRYDVAVSTSADLPRLQALPAVLEYPHGCFEQITSRVLVYCGVHGLFNAVPTNPEQGKRYRQTVEEGLAKCAGALLPDGRLPYWPSEKEGNPFVTVQAAWAARLAGTAGFKVDEDLDTKLGGAVEKIAGDAGVAPAVRAFAMLALATPTTAATGDAAGDDDSKGGGVDEDAARALFLHRETLGDEGRALLAVALHRAKILPDETHQLLREILPLATGAKPVPERAFEPATFGSTRRTEALTAWACATVRPPEWKPADAANARTRLATLLDRGALNSTQENVWALFAFQALRKAENAPKLRLAGTNPEPASVSPDKTAAEWTGLALGPDAAPFGVPEGLAPAGEATLHGVLTAEYRVGTAEEDARRDRGGMRVERVVHNLTDPKRTGRPDEPAVQVNDRLLVTYRMQTPKPRAYVALEDELPAGVEAVNPDLPLFAPFYQLPELAPGEREAGLSSSELRDNVTRAYFDWLEPGVSVYSVLARATAAGKFHWPATVAGPMYEPAVGGLAPSEVIVVEGE